MRDVPTMVRTTQSVRRFIRFAMFLAAGLVFGVLWGLFLLAIWRAV